MKNSTNINRNYNWIYNLLIIISLMSIFAISSTAIPVPCANITENYQVNHSQTWSECVLNLDDYDVYVDPGSIIINSNNIVLDCNSSQLVGDLIEDSIGIYNNGFTNVTIKNCFFSNHFKAILEEHTSNVYIINNTFNNTRDSTNVNFADVLFSYVNHSYILNNSFMKNDTTTIFKIRGGKAIRTMNDAQYNVIDNNRIYLRQPAIELRNNGSYNNITNNIIGYSGQTSGSSGEAIYLRGDSDYVLIKNNFIQNCSRNCINVDTDHVDVINNTVLDSNHDFIDLRNGYFRSYVLIENNTIAVTQPLVYTWDKNAVWIDQAANCTIRNNRILNLVAIDCNNSNAFGIGASDDISWGNVFENNYVENVTSWTMRDLQAKTTFRNNTMKNVTSRLASCDGTQISHYGLGGQDNFLNTPIWDTLILDNHWLDGIVTYAIAGTIIITNITINETSTISHTINFTNGASLTLLYDGRKDINLTNNTFTVRGLHAPYDSVYDANNNVLLATNQTTYSLKTSTNQRIIISNFTLNISISNYDRCTVVSNYKYNGLLNITYTSKNVRSNEIQNLTWYVTEPVGDYYIGITTCVSNDTCNTIFSDLFYIEQYLSPIERLDLNLKQNCSGTRNVVFVGFGLFAMLSIVGSAAVLIYMWNNSADGTTVMMTAIGVIGLAIVLMVGYVIVTYVGNSTCGFGLLS